jgi:CBS domain-containing protein
MPVCPWARNLQWMNMNRESEGSYLTPRPEHAQVADAMRHGLVKCSAETDLRQAARTMSTEHVHMVAITDPSDGSVVGTLTDMALLEALLDDPDLHRSLGEVADPSAHSISSDKPLLLAANTMRDLQTSHLLVRDAHNGHPIGVISTLDVAGVLAWGEA